ncbi:MAG: hypothetical protein DRN96_04985 [Thermoproteota archaeon]|nr:MAG: hypothetical protein DRN96_04985 [Candidatus Korarchaeota archaeon]RLG54577.1 MAG: hypothetical protein DRN99_04820 [Candidatus Korarchaeota archaeon]
MHQRCGGQLKTAHLRSRWARRQLTHLQLAATAALLQPGASATAGLHRLKASSTCCPESGCT